MNAVAVAIDLALLLSLSGWLARRVLFRGSGTTEATRDRVGEFDMSRQIIEEMELGQKELEDEQPRGRTLVRQTPQRTAYRTPDAQRSYIPGSPEHMFVPADGVPAPAFDRRVRVRDYLNEQASMNHEPVDASLPTHTCTIKGIYRPISSPYEQKQRLRHGEKTGGMRRIRTIFVVRTQRRNKHSFVRTADLDDELNEQIDLAKHL